MRVKSVVRCCARGSGSVALVALVLGSTGCLSGKDVSVLDVNLAPAPAATGTLQLPLTATAPSGTTYRLSGAHFAISNPFVNPPFDTVVSGDSDVLNVPLPPSAFALDYTITLQDGWALVEKDPDGTEHSVAASLDGPAFQSFTIRSDRVTPIDYQFVANGTRVATGSGSVSVRAVVDDTIIDDFEDGDGQLIAVARRNGSWFTFSDGTGIETPAPGSPVVPQVLDADANFVLHATGRNFSPAVTLPDGSFAFGAGVGLGLRVDPKSQLPSPYDASGYGGLHFEFKMSFPATTRIRLSFLVATRATATPAEGGTCTTNCNDDFGFFGTLNTSPFSFSGNFTWDQLKQQGFGMRVAFDPKAILSLKWLLAFPDNGQGASADAFDFQLDNVSFLPLVSDPAPAGQPAAPQTPAANDAPDAAAPLPTGASWTDPR